MDAGGAKAMGGMEVNIACDCHLAVHDHALMW